MTAKTCVVIENADTKSSSCAEPIYCSTSVRRNGSTGELLLLITKISFCLNGLSFFEGLLYLL